MYTSISTASNLDAVNISQLVGSSQYRALADDSLKDEDNVAWVMGLDLPVRQEWIERIAWIRLVDRLAENDLLDVGSSKFQEFRRDWQFLLRQRSVQRGSAYQSALTGMARCWLGEVQTRVHRLSISAWDCYLQAISTYHQPNLTIETLDEYEQMLENLAGRFFQILPFLSPENWQAACYFGMLDQFYNNLRDLREDAEQGICYFPTEVLDRFGVTRQEILQCRCFSNPGYYRLMEFWLDEYLPRLHRKADGLIRAKHLHPSWKILRDWSLTRYRRIEAIFRRCQFDYARFPFFYWEAVIRDLQHWKS